MRLTKDVRQQLLDLNEGFTTQTSFEGNNGSADRHYEIRSGELHIRIHGKGGWGAANERYGNEYVADEDQTHRFLSKNLSALNTDGLD
jgi:hypothetical protein